MSAEHLIFATSALISPLAVYFTSLVRHGFMPSCLWDCILIPAPKKNKDVTSSSSYCPITLASSISKILEHLILTKFSSYLHTSSLSAIVLGRFLSLLSSALSSSSSLVQSIFSVSSLSVYSFTGYNNVYGANHIIDYSYSDLSLAHMICRIQHCYGSYSPCEDLICYLSCL